MDANGFRRLIVGWFIFAAFSIGIMVGLMIMILAAPKEETIICPPMIDAAERVNLFYPPDGGPEPTELDYEFAEACGFETIKGPVKIQPPAPEEGA